MRFGERATVSEKHSTIITRTLCIERIEQKMDAQKEFEVEKIRNKRIRNGRVSFVLLYHHNFDFVLSNIIQYSVLKRLNILLNGPDIPLKIVRGKKLKI